MGIHRRITRAWMADAMEGWLKKYRKASEIEPLMKKTIFGKVQFQWSSNHFCDDIPWFSDASGGRGNKEEKVIHHMDDPIYVRKYLEPAKFKKSVTLDELVAAGMQYGHAAGVWNPKMLKFLYSEHDGTHIFDLVQTAASMNRACYYAMEAAAKGATFCFVGTKEQGQGLIAPAAKRVNACYCDYKYAGGTFTNWNMVRKGVDLMTKMREDQAQGLWRSENPLKQQMLKNRLRKLTKKFQGIEQMEDLPDIVILVDEFKERKVVNETTRIGIPVIGLVDSNNDPTFIDLPVPGNASGSRSIDLFLTKITEAILRGQSIRANTPIGDREEIPKEWDPWIFSTERLRYLRRRSKRQPWYKSVYGSYEAYKKVHPYGRIPAVAPFKEDWSWKI